MIKALRIACIIAVVLASVFFVFPVVFGVQRDEQAEQFLKSPGVIEQFSRTKGGKKAKSEDQVSPLVEQAEAFALYLNPPKPKEPEIVPSRTAKGAHKPKTVTPKFDLIGTSFYELHPELSLALIDEPGKGFRWVRQSSEVGHLIIEEIKDGIVVVRDSERTFELVAERPERINLVKQMLPVGADIQDGKAQPGDEEPAGMELPHGTEELPDSKEPPSSKGPLPQNRRKIEILPEEMLSKLKTIQSEFEPDGNDWGDEQGTKLEKIISDFETMRITDQEARKLEKLGEQLKDIRQDPNQAEDGGIEADANFSDANLSDANNPE